MLSSNNSDNKYQNAPAQPNLQEVEKQAKILELKIELKRLFAYASHDNKRAMLHKLLLQFSRYKNLANISTIDISSEEQIQFAVTGLSDLPLTLALPYFQCFLQDVELKLYTDSESANSNYLVITFKTINEFINHHAINFDKKDIYNAIDAPLKSVSLKDELLKLNKTIQKNALTSAEEAAIKILQDYLTLNCQNECTRIVYSKDKIYILTEFKNTSKYLVRDTHFGKVLSIPFENSQGCYFFNINTSDLLTSKLVSEKTKLMQLNEVIKNNENTAKIDNNNVANEEVEDKDSQANYNNSSNSNSTSCYVLTTLLSKSYVGLTEEALRLKLLEKDQIINTQSQLLDKQSALLNENDAQIKTLLAERTVLQKAVTENLLSPKLALNNNRRNKTESENDDKERGAFSSFNY